LQSAVAGQFAIHRHEIGHLKKIIHFDNVLH
jgi:hypothetical protein